MRLRDIPLGIKLILCFFGFPLFLIIWAVACSFDMTKTLSEAEKNPNEENVLIMLEAWNRIKLSVNNHPDTWQKLRNAWYKINGSPKVPTYLKKQVLEVFKRKGLHVSNDRIIDNYSVVQN